MCRLPPIKSTIPCHGGSPDRGCGKLLGRTSGFRLLLGERLKVVGKVLCLHQPLIHMVFRIARDHVARLRRARLFVCSGHAHSREVFARFIRAKLGNFAFDGTERMLPCDTNSSNSLGSAGVLSRCHARENWSAAPDLIVELAQRPDESWPAILAGLPLADWLNYPLPTVANDIPAVRACGVGTRFCSC
jgi:hypothetical protein